MVDDAAGDAYGLCAKFVPTEVAARVLESRIAGGMVNDGGRAGRIVPDLKGQRSLIRQCGGVCR